MMQRFVLPAAVAAAVAFGAGSAQAQQLPLSIEIRGGAALPTGDWNDDDVFETGLGFGAAVTFRPTSALGVYAGWDRFSFGVDDEEAGEEEVDASLNDSGFRAGAELALPVSGAPVSPFVSAGVFYGKTELEVDGDVGSVGFETDSSIGFEAAVGVGFNAGPVTVRPAVGYRTRSLEFEGEEAGEDDTISYFTFILGISLNP
jgi:opacity protein-like surface antigen